MALLNKGILVNDYTTVINDLGLSDFHFQKVNNPSSNHKDFNRYHLEACYNKSIYPLAKTRSVTDKFIPLQPKDIQNAINLVVENNPGIEVVYANQYNYGERVEVQLSLINSKFSSNIEGIGDLEPSIFMLFPVYGSVKIVTSTMQLFCSNQIPSLANDPINQFISINHTKNIYEDLKQSILSLNDLENAMRNQIEKLEVFSSVEADDEDFEKFIVEVFNLDKSKLEKSKTMKKLRRIYEEAPNAQPGTLLGCLNSVTRYFSEKPYKKDVNLSNLPSSPAYKTSKFALELCSNINRLGWEYLA